MSFGYSDDLGERMKTYEAQTTNRFLMPGLPVYARIDGRAFHTFCRGLNKPFCFELIETMQEVTRFLVEETNAQLGYVQSDEISLCWLDINKAPFNGKLHKLESVLASLATSKFVNHITLKTGVNEQWTTLFNKCQKINPSFDCRVFQLPNEVELANVFVWREIDAIRNSVSMVAQANFSHKELQHKSSKDKITMLEEKGIHWNELDSIYKKGSYFKKQLVIGEISDTEWEKIPVNKRPLSRSVIRSQVVLYDIPEMRNIVNKVGVYFYDEEPVAGYKFEDDNE